MEREEGDHSFRGADKPWDFRGRESRHLRRRAPPFTGKLRADDHFHAPIPRFETDIRYPPPPMSLSISRNYSFLEGARVPAHTIPSFVSIDFFRLLQQFVFYTILKRHLVPWNFEQLIVELIELVVNFVIIPLTANSISGNFGEFEEEHEPIIAEKTARNFLARSRQRSIRRRLTKLRVPVRHTTLSSVRAYK